MGFVRIVPVLSTNSLFVLLVFSTPVHGVTIEITAHPISTKSWGTGVWVSENYLFWGRVMKFFLLLPALHKERLEVKNINYKKEFCMIQRFVSTTQACLCHLMSTKRIVPDLEETILLYMDTMVELDRWILCLPQDDSMLGSNDQDPDDVEPMNVDISDNLPDLPAKHVAPVCNVTRMKTKKKSSRMKLPKIVKSNSLGMLAAAMEWFTFPFAQWEEKVQQDHQ